MNAVQPSACWSIRAALQTGRGARPLLDFMSWVTSRVYWCLCSENRVAIIHTSCSDITPLTPELNPSAQRCLTRVFTGILFLQPCSSLIYAWKTDNLHQLFVQFINYIW
jgi:hypothetical protein